VELDKTQVAAEAAVGRGQ